MTSAQTFICQHCEGTFPMDKCGLGFNFGNGPEYFCKSCKPPLSPEKEAAMIKSFIDVASAISENKDRK
jgi:hypothetical protein